MLNVIMLIFIMLNVIMLIFIMLNVIMLTFIMLNVIMLTFIMLNNIYHKICRTVDRAKCCFAECCLAECRGPSCCAFWRLKHRKHFNGFSCWQISWHPIEHLLEWTNDNVNQHVMAKTLPKSHWTMKIITWIYQDCRIQNTLTKKSNFFINFLIQYYLVIIFWTLVMLPYPQHWKFPLLWNSLTYRARTTHSTWEHRRRKSFVSMHFCLGFSVLAEANDWLHLETKLTINPNLQSYERAPPNHAGVNILGETTWVLWHST